MAGPVPPSPFLPARGTTPRLYELDWLRVLAFGTLVFFHSAMPFTHDDWHIKNDVQYRVFDEFIAFFHEFRLPLLFVVSGAGIGFAMRKRSALAFAGERTRRLLLPLLFGMAAIVP